MFSKLFVAASLAILAVATPAPWGSSGSTTPNACCTSTTTAGNSAFAGLFQSLGIDISNVNVPIGLGCSPITVVGVSGTSCTNDPVSCDQIFTPSLVGLNCVPVDVSG
ncbi:fungal hydrophobin [Schizopora paradoxa]|uniref:Hydrophobin n=1 Tax=Schizopora paradoxa TaxID=27342 RepID=A0A0H2RW85_9AGAM|nr:fungal hydrophobin [Schizopora paradoxa]